MRIAQFHIEEFGRDDSGQLRAAVTAPGVDPVEFVYDGIWQVAGGNVEPTMPVKIALCERRRKLLRKETREAAAA